MLYLVISNYNDDYYEQNALTFNQYGNPNLQSQNSDYSNFDGTKTYNNLKNANKGYENSIQGILLKNGKLARAFDVNQFTSKNSDLIKNFFLQITVDIGKCNACYDYPCNGLNCQAPVNICGCDGVPHSGKTNDPDGRCCLDSDKDCLGYCSGRTGGNYNYDSCGVCTLGGALSSLCKQDPCNNQYYLTAKPSVPYIFNGCTDAFAAGYVVQNTDLWNLFNTNTAPIKTKADICNHYNNNGRFEQRFTCTFDVAYYNTANGVSNALTHFFARSPPRTGARCLPGSRTPASPIPKNSCGVCVPFPDAAPFCVKDCLGQWETDPEDVDFYNTCNRCVPYGTPPDGDKDDCGVCNGGNALKNECGVCGGPKGNDACGQHICLNKNCTEDCDGVSRNPLLKQVDECGNCVWKTDVRNSFCIQDCKGVWYMSNQTKPNHLDECNNCVPQSIVRENSCVQDCKDVWGGQAAKDKCNQCLNPGDTPPYPCLQDCAGNYYRDGIDPILKKVDDCGVCNLIADMNELKDKCGKCTNVAGYNSATECTPDCKGNYYLADALDCSITQSCKRAFTDSCGDCWFANETEKRNTNMDDCGECHAGGESDPDWNSSKNKKDTQNVPCACFVDPTPCPAPNQALTSCNDGTSCPSLFCNGTSVYPDSCGLCPDSSMYNKTDDCGICCDPPGIACNQDKDSCGECFGFDKQKTLNPCKVCNGTLCTVDCHGTPYGTAVLDCQGICGGNSVCSKCGNGVVDEGESCDLGKENGVEGSGCTTDCQSITGQSNTGQIVGGVIGGIAAVAFLALAAVMALKFAKSKGMFGNAKNQVDFGASNSNPLYQSEVNVQQNPLYASS